MFHAKGTFQQVQILGFCGQDAELRKTKGGTAVANVSIATTSKNGENETTTWHTLTFWGKLAEYVGQNVKKGDKIFVNGSIREERWEKDGQEYRRNVIDVSDFSFAGSQK